ncbi:Retrovirus-related Pol polyprotein, partial [Mucuna pruriens]
MEVFMDDFIVYTDTLMPRKSDPSIEAVHRNRPEGIVLSHLVLSRGIEVDKAKIDIITSLPNPAFVWQVRSFPGHVDFYRRFIKNFNKIALLLSKLLQKDVEFVFNKECVQAFEELKTRLTSTPILQAPNWELPFELMWDASNSALGAVLGQQDGVAQLAHEFVLEIRDKKGADNVVADHLSRIECEPNPMPI